jgi:hypothetical protein
MIAQTKQKAGIVNEVSVINIVSFIDYISVELLFHIVIDDSASSI